MASDPGRLTVSSSVDPDEVRFFERLAERWWDPSGPFWPLHRLNGVRQDYLSDQLSRHFAPTRESRAAQRPLDGLRILDIGCGGGLLSEALAESGADVHGIDVVERNIQVARTHAESRGLKIHYEMITVEQLAERDTQYDAVMNLEVIEHVADVESFLSKSCTLVRPGGLMALASLNRTVLAFLGAIVFGEYLLRWLPVGTHRWSRFPRPAELRTQLASNGMGVCETVGVRVNPFTRQFALSRICAINFMMIAVKPN